MENSLIGRKEESEILLDALQSKEAEMVAVIGRRRVGKTFLIKEIYKKEIRLFSTFHFGGNRNLFEESKYGLQFVFPKQGSYTTSFRGFMPLF